MGEVIDTEKTSNLLLTMEKILDNGMFQALIFSAVSMGIQE